MKSNQHIVNTLLPIAIFKLFLGSIFPTTNLKFCFFFDQKIYFLSITPKKISKVKFTNNFSFFTNIFF